MPTTLHNTNALYAITDCANLRGAALYSPVQQALAGGCRFVQYRDKSDDKVRRYAEATQLLKLCRQFNAKLIINDDVALARSVKADGVHLGQSDSTIREARQALGAKAIIGATCHSDMELARYALQDGANYVAFGRFFPSATKPDAPPARLSLLTQVRRRWPDCCIVAIGGITQANAELAIQQGANYVAVCHDVCHHPNPTAYARAFARTSAA
ncbi:thiamine phosphate synthase [Gilvimarinus sp. SDUM040013]|uniref:Thiamine-phosphate synthase n=1 Tax=Gilvimarinus gilvus TaxID=3058038 RepID=A0ABU4RVX0_9GAMM|nr:thiamine phosphate synthase [Gilvimarinus sp. SDUM040013]MDO3386719.1 thiamine phosphate synthase [Gilvimarinus sp. SDUM040013]MDX6848351.1 thiamine phosphate synthase [Gilvimarinus sp. SDUM040013]